tara:strand:- start:551 stop:769 length:219 start_codon:yes stop_codon:yes gene_type:complete
VKLTKARLKKIIKEEIELNERNDFKKVRKVLDGIRKDLGSLIKYGEDYSVFQDAKFASKTLKKAWREIAKIK